MVEDIRLNKYLSEAGVCSRREADRLIESGKVTVDGKVATMGMRILPIQEVKVKGQSVRKEQAPVLLALNKPRGIVCTSARIEKNNIVDFVNYPIRIYPVGRLDKDSQGLILMTNQGELVNRIMKARNYHEKEYVVKVDKKITEDFLQRMANGVPILDTVTRPCKLTKVGQNTFRIILTQGLNRQIRRMCEYLGYRVTKLERVRIMNIKLKDLPIGKYREVTQEELHTLFELTKDSAK